MSTYAGIMRVEIDERNASDTYYEIDVKFRGKVILEIREPTMHEAYTKLAAAGYEKGLWVGQRTPRFVFVSEA